MVSSPVVMMAAEVASSGAATGGAQLLGTLAALPAVVLLPLALLAALTLAVVGRLASHTVLRGPAPPVFEGVPFIGGMLKFAIVSI
jgi:hypothetical protein